MSSGGKDVTCLAVKIWKRSTIGFQGRKTLMHVPRTCPHTSCAAFYEMTWPWLDFYLRK